MRTKHSHYVTGVPSAANHTSKEVHMSRHSSRCICGFIMVSAWLAASGAAFAQGSLTPPGAPAPVMKTLDQIEPRIPISSAPYNITNSGSYYLTGNLTATGGYDAITVSARDVDIDLGGYIISGLGSGNVGIGIGLGAVNLEVRNGTIRDFLGGISTPSIANSRFKDLRLTGNSIFGLYCGPGSAIESCSSYGNGGDGFVANANSTVSGSVASRNGGYGFASGGGSAFVDCTASFNTNGGFNITASGATLSRCTARQNGGAGFITVASTISECTANENAFEGIFAGQGGTISHCTANQNAGSGISIGDGGSVMNCSVTANTNAGIVTLQGCTVTESSARRNGLAGIIVGNGSVLRNCIAQTNKAAGISAGSGVKIENCTSLQNANEGISATTGGSIVECTVKDNGGAGISATSSSTVRGNTCIGNGTAGVAAGILISGNNNRIEDNHCSGNDFGLDVNGSGNHVTGNSVIGNSDNYDFAADNRLDLLLGQIPETIDWPANVTLAGSLNGVPGSNGIIVASDNVTIDLAGHTLQGVTNGGYGIVISGGVRRGLTVRDGIVRGWGLDGLQVSNATYSTFINVRSVTNGAAAFGTGFKVGTHSTFTGCIAELNRGDGFNSRSLFGGQNNVFSHCEARGNGFHGFEVEGGCVIEKSKAEGNTSAGFFLESWNRVTQSEAHFNGGSGLRCNYGNSIGDNVFTGNDGAAIDVSGPRNTIERNFCMDNGYPSASSIYVSGSNNNIDGNKIVGGYYGIQVVASPNIITRNSATMGYVGTNYSVNAGNSFGLVHVTGAFTNTNPWINFSF